MPKKILTHGTYSSSSIEGCPATAVEFAKIVMGWAQIENALVTMFSGALGRPGETIKFPGDADGNFAMRLTQIHHDEVAGMVLGEVSSFSRRLNIINNTFERFLEKSANDNWRPISSALKQAGHERNFVVHAEWGVADDLEKGLFVALRNGKFEAWSVRDFRRVATHIEALRIQVKLFAGRALGLFRTPGQEPSATVPP